MNENFKKLLEQSYSKAFEECIQRGHQVKQIDAIFNSIAMDEFAKLIVQECYEHCKGEMMDKKLAEEAGLTYNDGVMDCAIGLLQHFGVE